MVETEVKVKVEAEMEFSEYEKLKKSFDELLDFFTEQGKGFSDEFPEMFEFLLEIFGDE